MGNEEPSWGRGSKASLLLPSRQRYRPWLLVLRSLRSLVYPSLWLECSPNAFSLSLGLGGGCSTGNLTRPVPSPRAIQDRCAFPLMRCLLCCAGEFPTLLGMPGMPGTLFTPTARKMCHLLPWGRRQVLGSTPLIAMESSVRLHQTCFDRAFICTWLLRMRSDALEL